MSSGRRFTGLFAQLGLCWSEQGGDGRRTASRDPDKGALMRGRGSALPAVTLVGDPGHFVRQVNDDRRSLGDTPGLIRAVGRKAGANKALPTTSRSLIGRAVSGTKSQQGGEKTKDCVRRNSLMSAAGGPAGGALPPATRRRPRGDASLSPAGSCFLLHCSGRQGGRGGGLSPRPATPRPMKAAGGSANEEPRQCRAPFPP